MKVINKIHNRPPTPKQKTTIDKITSFFENGTTRIHYDYAENLKDGRGITCGRSGFCTGTGDAYLVVKKYSERQPKNMLAKFLPELERLNSTIDSSNISGLRGFISAWRKCSKDELFCTVQDEINDELYFNPARSYARKLRLKTAIARAILYDTIIQHGDGDDADSIAALIDRAGEVTDETTWLKNFLKVRRMDLLNPANLETAKVWRESVERVDALQSILSSGNLELELPLQVECFGKKTTIR
ncbi:MAG: chitosanase [Acidobacteriota bacterium]|nr:chitosanase [Acidobacteriota bacterium]